MLKKFFIKSMLLGGAVLATIIIFNYVVDLYGVLRRDADNIVVTPNDKYVKINHVLNSPGRYDSFSFGSSRAGHIHTHQLSNGKWYNMYYWSGIPYEWMRSIQVFVKNGVEIKNVLITIGPFSYKSEPEERQDKFLFRFYPETFREKIVFFTRYLFKQPSLVEIKRKYRPIEKWGLVFDYGNTGNYYITKLEHDIELDPDRHRKSKYFAQAMVVYGNQINEYVNQVREIKRICDANGINLHVLFHPIHHLNFLNEDTKLMNTAKRRLVSITDFYDFSGLNTVTIDNYYYTDVVHFRPKVGDMMLKKIFGEPDVKVPPDFGVKVTGDNIERHLEFLMKQRKVYNETGRVISFTE